MGSAHTQMARLLIFIRKIRLKLEENPAQRAAETELGRLSALGEPISERGRIAEYRILCDCSERLRDGAGDGRYPFLSPILLLQRTGELTTSLRRHER